MTLALFWTVIAEPDAQALLGDDQCEGPKMPKGQKILQNSGDSGALGPHLILQS